jgi:acyl dehydratase
LHVGDTLDVRVTVAAKEEKTHHVMLDCLCADQEGRAVITGSALVLAPREKIRRERLAPPQVRLTDKTVPL